MSEPTDRRWSDLLKGALRDMGVSPASSSDDYFFLRLNVVKEAIRRHYPDAVVDVVTNTKICVRAPHQTLAQEIRLNESLILDEINTSLHSISPTIGDISNINIIN